MQFHNPSWSHDDPADSALRTSGFIGVKFAETWRSSCEMKRNASILAADEQEREEERYILTPLIRTRSRMVGTGSERAKVENWMNEPEVVRHSNNGSRRDI